MVHNSTILIEKNKIKMNLTNIDNEFNNLQLKLYILKNGIFRVKIRENQKRFHVFNTYKFS